MITWQIIFWTTLLLIMHSYLLYPWILQLLSSKRKENDIFFDDNELPPVTVIMSVFNEEEVLERKLESILGSNYPAYKLQVLVGSDASTDRTNEILKKYENSHPEVTGILFDERQGKPGVINRLVEMCTDEFIIMTDAKVIFHSNTVHHLMRNFKNREIGIVGGNIVNESMGRDGVSIQETAFMSREILMKYREGLAWGATIGVYGAIYALRKELYSKVPAGFAVDDFFISMNVLRKKSRAILDINTVTYHKVPNLLSEEYRRKVRIATGNYRNLRYFGRELLTPWKGASFAYISHKVIRWLGPFFLLLFAASAILLFGINTFYSYALYATAVIMVLPIFDFLLSKIGIHIVFLRFVRHFITMNIALLHGFLNNLGGINKDVWRPTNR